MTSLPSIAPYPMPGGADLPEARLPWEVDPDRCVLLVHDMQAYFLDAFDREAEPVPDLLANIAALRDGCAEAGVPIIYTAQPGSQSPGERGLLGDLWGPGLGDLPEHTAIVDPLAPADEEAVLTKWRYSAFVRTGLERRVRERGRDQLVICGVYAHIGVLMTACDAFMRDLEAFVVTDAVADFSATDHAMALSYVARRCGSTPTTRSVLAALGG